MKYCIDYYEGCQILNKVDEINFKYNRIESTEALLNFCQEYPKQRINICMEELDIEAIKNMLEFQKNNPNINVYIRIPEKSEELSMLLKDYENPKFFFDIKINNWDILVSCINYGVSDIYIVECLGFELDKIAKLAHDRNIQIRVYPNIAQSLSNDIDDLRKFWIRPEDIDFYGQYVDVCEFIGLEKDRIETMYNIYKKDKKWFGNLAEIIFNLTEPIDSRYMVPRFVKKRVKCGRECMKGGSCQMCDKIKELSGNLEKAGLIITMDKDNEEEENNG